MRLQWNGKSFIMSTGTSPESNDKSINTLKNLKGPQEYNQKTEMYAGYL